MNEETYIKKWLEGNLTEEEQKTFEKTDLYASLKKLDQGLQAYKAPEFDSAAEYSRLSERMGKSNGKQIRVNWMQRGVAAAAVISLLVVSFIWVFSDKTRVIETATAEVRTVILPDSSLVILNALSKISFDEDDWKEDRKLILEGEAFFQVAKGSDFSVVTGQGIVTVLGTQFNVKDRKAYFEVICYEGLVSVNNQNSEEKLKKGYMFRLVDGEITYEQNDFYNFPHLLKNESAFFSVPFREVIEEFERHYSVKITVRGIDLETGFTGRFTHSDIDLALQSIAYPLNLTYKITDNNERIILSGATN